jgi:hypothetical protein
LPGIPGPLFQHSTSCGKGVTPGWFFSLSRPEPDQRLRCHLAQGFQSCLKGTMQDLL